MTWYIVLMIIYCGVETLIGIAYIDRDIKVTRLSAALTLIANVAFVIGLLAITGVL
jgi:hypothetical protein